ncbi:MAG: hypothetical protein P4N41_16505 [Negativicutes bacterium]|nr:hypothetical protein [Negativicutes bacterium]
MQRYAKVALFFCLFALVSLASFSLAQASPTKMTISVQVEDQTKKFWDYAYLTKDGYLSKAASIQVGWDVGTISKDLKYETAVVQGKNSGDVTITTEKGELVNYRISVRDAKNVELGSISMQVKNKGQTEFYYVALPEFTEPRINYSTEAPYDNARR